MEPLMMKVNIIQRPLLVAFLILPDDSNVESSNMASLESGVGYFLLDTAGTSIVPGAPKLRQTMCSQPIPNLAPTCKGCLKAGAVCSPKRKRQDRAPLTLTLRRRKGNR